MPLTSEQFGELDGLCLEKLAAVSFGLNKRPRVILDGIRFRIDKRLPISAKQRSAMYAICYRYREQLCDAKLVARTMIAKAELEQAVAEETRTTRPQIRAWAAPPDLFGKADRPAE